MEFSDIEKKIAELAKFSSNSIEREKLLLAQIEALENVLKHHFPLAWHDYQIELYKKLKTLEFPGLSGNY